MSVKVKICGITRIEDARAAFEAGADMIGLNFYAPSPRAVSLERAKEIRQAIDPSQQIVGVFVNAARDFIERCVEELRLDFIQFHGDEPDSILNGWPVPVIRALRLKPGDKFNSADHVSSQYILLDTFHSQLYGGTGAKRPLSDLHGLDLARVFISGGLDSDNVHEAAALSPFAVDVASGVESAPGVKDHRKLRSFIRNAKSAR
ncbi:MAG TPA: phosphoribosylanthranilate isomerase [Candidatus Binataceae bacterium]|nr:phosphoribosylanthranilate isomerase [Candidatus Binataceae bacterium]